MIIQRLILICVIAYGSMILAYSSEGRSVKNQMFCLYLPTSFAPWRWDVMVESNYWTSGAGPWRGGGFKKYLIDNK